MSTIHISPASPINLAGDVQELQNIVRALPQPVTSMPNPVDGVTVAPTPDGTGTVIGFKVISLVGVGSIGIYRNVSLDQGSAALLNSFDVSSLQIGNPIAFTDTSAPPGVDVVYWVTAFPQFSNLSPIFNGPFQVSANALPSGPIGQLLSFNASKTAGVGGFQQINIAFTPPSDPTFGSAKILISGYKGVAASVAIAQNATSPFSFELEETGEVVTLTGVAVDLDGTQADPSGAPTVTLTLDGAASVPNPVSNLSAAALTTGVQLEWSASPEPDIIHYKVFRGAYLAGFGAAFQIGTVIPSGEKRYSFLDTGGLTGNNEWYVVATGGAGDSSPQGPVNVQIVIASGQMPPNVPQNFTNFASVNSFDAGDGTATAQVFGTGGVGSPWNRQTGSGLVQYPEASILGLVFSTNYYVLFDGVGYQAVLMFPNTMPDGWTFVAFFETCGPGGGGGTTGGGGANGNPSGGPQVAQ